jgi:agmatinase
MVQKSPPGGPAMEVGGTGSGSVPTPSRPRLGRGPRLAGARRKASEAFRAGRNRLEPTVAGRVWKQLAGLGVIDSSLQFAAVFTLGFIPFLMVLSAVLGSGPSRAIVIGSGFSFSAQAGHRITTLFTHSRIAPATQSMLGLVVAVLGGLAISHMIQTWYATIFRAQVHGWKAFARRAEWLAGVFGLVALQVVIGRRIEPPGGHIAAAGAQFLLAIVFWWWSLHCLLSGQVPWRRLFPAGLSTALCCTGLGLYIAYVASPAIVANEARYGPIGVVMTLVTAEIGLGVAVQLGAVVGATVGRDQRTRPGAVRDPGRAGRGRRPRAPGRGPPGAARRRCTACRPDGEGPAPAVTRSPSSWVVGLLGSGLVYTWSWAGRRTRPPCRRPSRRASGNCRLSTEGEMTEPVRRIVTGDTVGPVDATAVPRYGGAATFARLPRLDEVARADVAILGVPFDGGVSYRPGARFGPSHIRESSRLLRPYNPALQVPVFAGQQVADAGDLTANPFSIDEAIIAIERGARALLERTPFVLTLGGDHTVALPMLRAVSAVQGPVAVVHFDAHLDTWDTYFGAAYTHGTPFRRAAEEGLLDRTGCLHVGIRGPLYTAADLTEDSELGFQVVSAPDVEQIGVAGMVERIRERVGDRPVYVSVDIDVLDPAHAPGTGTPEAGGLTSRELLAALRSFARLNLVGADIVEVAPAYDHAQITGIAAAHVAYELLSALAARKPAP